MEQERVVFDLQSDQVKLKGILQSTFLELEMQVISEGKNRNQTSFSLSSMEHAIPTFKERPILGFFNQGDFESHNGAWKDNPVTGDPYFDNSKGEQILGLIREKDKVQIQPVAGKNWITLNCAIWVKYATLQVLRLLKDKKKKVSVEIEITKYHMNPDDPNDPVRYIDEFELCGITILGTRNGKPVLEGIEGASLSVLDQIDERVFNSQRQALCYAYAELDNKQAVENNNAKKEEEGNVDNNDNTMNTDTMNFDNTNTDCGTDNVSQNDCGDASLNPQSSGDDTSTTSNNACGDGDSSNDDAGANGDSQNSADDTDGSGSDGENDDNPPQDTGDNQDDATDGQHADNCGTQLAAANEQIMTLNNALTEANNKLAELQAQFDAISQQLEEANKMVELHKDYDAIVTERNELQKTVTELRIAELTSQAKAFCAQHNIDENHCNTICDKCKSGEYQSFEQVKQEVAMLVFNQLNSVNNRYQSPINTIIDQSNNVNKSQNCFDRMHARNQK